MSEYTLEAKTRKVIGKKVKQLRREGIVPAVVYGPEFENINVQVPEKPLRMTLFEAGGTQIIDLQMGKESIPTLVKKVQRDPITLEILHVDFYRVSMDRAIRAEVPLAIAVEPEIVKSGMAIATLHTNSLEIEALPMDLPPVIELDLSGLTEIGDQLLVGDLQLSGELTIMTDASELITKIDYAQALEEEEEEEELEELLAAEPSAGDVEVITERKPDEEE
jgi:large subunit ribosomal protein L25